MIPRICILISLTVFCLGCSRPDFNNTREETYQRLEETVAQKKTQLIQSMTEVRALAGSIQQDKAMTAFFNVKRAYYNRKKDTVVSEYVTGQIEKLKKDIQFYYLTHYITFYDILFIDTSGEIFYTIRKQRDYHKNIFQDELASTTLSRKLDTRPVESFVDFQFYEVSGEPSAFFIEPVIENGEIQGWFVLQYAINKINSLFTSGNLDATTGEIVLVNREHYLLTNSRFEAGSTILKQQLSESNIESKFKEKKGRKSVIDYRGREVYSAFEVFSFINSEWLIIAKIDKDEVLTRYYKNNKKIVNEKLTQCLLSMPEVPVQTKELEHSSALVDIDEFFRIDTSGTLFTQGVSECTAFIATYPKKFAYMAHISPYDNIYGEKRTNLIQEVLNQITYFEITQVEKQDVKFYLISTQNHSIMPAIDLLISNGYFLSQIKVLLRPETRYGNIEYNVQFSEPNVTWVLNDRGENASENFRYVAALDELLLSPCKV